MYRRIHLSNGAWSVSGVRLLVTPAERLRGLNLPDTEAVLLLVLSVHTFTMSRPVGVVAIDIRGFVTATQVMQPRRMLLFRVRHWILEVPPDASLPVLGSRIVAYTGSSEMSGV